MRDGVARELTGVFLGAVNIPQTTPPCPREVLRAGRALPAKPRLCVRRRTAAAGARRAVPAGETAAAVI